MISGDPQSSSIHSLRSSPAEPLLLAALAAVGAILPFWALLFAGSNNGAYIWLINVGVSAGLVCCLTGLVRVARAGWRTEGRRGGQAPLALVASSRGLVWFGLGVFLVAINVAALMWIGFIALQ